MSENRFVLTRKEKIMRVVDRVITKPGYALLAVAILFMIGSNVAYRADVAQQMVGQKMATESEIDILRYVINSHEFRIARMEWIFAESGSPAPKSMAKAVMATKDPRRSAAQAIVESNGNPKAKGQAGEKGAYQVIERDWGKVPKTAHDQAQQNDKIMGDLLSACGDLEGALVRYNSCTNKKQGKIYAKKVMTVMARIP